MRTYMVDLQDVESLRIIYQLKSVYRWNSVEDRKESSAEHTWSAMLLADALKESVEEELDMQRVFELLLYHDLVEIETGDMPIHPEKEHLRVDKQAIEEKGGRRLANKLPSTLSGRYLELFSEFEDYQTIEARYAKAMDALDGALQALDYPQDYEGFSKQDFIRKKRKYFEGFPELLILFDELTEWMAKENYFS